MQAACFGVFIFFICTFEFLGSDVPFCLHILSSVPSEYLGFMKGQNLFSPLHLSTRWYYFKRGLGPPLHCKECHDACISLKFTCSIKFKWFTFQVLDSSFLNPPPLSFFKQRRAPLWWFLNCWVGCGEVERGEIRKSGSRGSSCSSSGE